MTLPPAADLDAMMADFGVTVTLDGYTAIGHFNAADVEILPGEAAPQFVRYLALKVRSDALPTLAVGSRPTVNGTAYRVRELQQLDGGAITEMRFAL
jgi:hypothetical protein